jgi:hypothetical protein
MMLLAFLTGLSSGIALTLIVCALYGFWLRRKEGDA